MNETVNTIVNLGIGTVKTLDEQAREALSTAEAKLNEYISVGEQATDENSAKVKELVQTAISNYNELSEKVLATVEDVQARVQELDPRNKEEAPAAATA